MKILHINCNYIGTSLHQNMVEHLTKIDTDNQVYVPIYNGSKSTITPNANVIVSECFKKRDRISFHYKQSKIKHDIQAKTDISNFDCIHAYTLFTDGNCARYLSKKYGIPYVVAVRNTDVNTFFKYVPHLRNLGVQIMRDAAGVFFLSPAYKKQVFDLYIPPMYHPELLKKTYVIPNGIDDFWFQNAANPRADDKPTKKIKIIYAGRIDKNKNIRTTQQAIEILSHRGWDISLTIVGNVVDQKEFAQICKNSNTTYLKAQPKEKLIEIYRNNDIFVMPSYTETFGLVYAEAISQGLPVIYSENQGFDGQFLEGEVGYHVSAYDPATIADAIEKIVPNIFEMSQRCIRNSFRFQWDDICKKYLDIYSKISW